MDAIPLVPANIANTGEIQHNDAVVAVSRDVPINFLLCFILYTNTLLSFTISNIGVIMKDLSLFSE